MAEITIHPEARIEIRPAIVDDEDNVIGMGTKIEVSFQQLVDAIAANLPEDPEGGET